MRVTMIGTGYVGLVSGACFADFGHTVTCVDKDASKIERLQKGEIPIFEPGLDELVKDNVEQGRLSFTTDPTAAIRDADAIFIAVGTPSRRGDGHADLSYVYAAAEEIAGLMNGYTRRRHQIDSAGGHGRRSRGHHQEDEPERGFRRGLEPGIPARRRRHRRFQAPGSRGRRHQ